MSVQITSLEEVPKKRRALRIGLGSDASIVTSSAVIKALGIEEATTLERFALLELYERHIEDPESDADQLDDEQVLRAIIAAVARRFCKKRANGLVSNRDYTTHEVTTRLLADGYDARLADETVAHLVEFDLLNDERYTRRFCEMRLGAGYGPYVIRRKLAEKGIDEDLISQSLDEVLAEGIIDPEERAARLIERFDLGDPRARQRAMRKLVSRGYEYECVKRVISP